MARIIRRLIPL